jgi:hypothetical protein
LTLPDQAALLLPESIIARRLRLAISWDWGLVELSTQQMSRGTSLSMGQVSSIALI